MIEDAVDFLLPSWWEVKVSVATTLFVVAAYWFFTSNSGNTDDDRSLVDNPGAARDFLDDIDKVNSDAPVKRRFSNQFCIYNQGGIVGS